MNHPSSATSGAPRPYPCLLGVDDYRPGLWDLRHDAVARAHWREMFRAQLQAMVAGVARHRGTAQRSAAERVAAEFERFSSEELEKSEGQLPHVHAWTVVRENLIAEFGLEDPYRELKESENESALLALPRLCQLLPEPRDHSALRSTIAAILIGNRFDMGAPGIASVAPTTHENFARSIAELAGSAWRIDHVGPLATALSGVRSAVIALDNAGPDFVCGVLLFARLLRARGIDVTLAANQSPSLNDVTCDEAGRIVAVAGEIVPELHGIPVLSTGNGFPGIDLRDVSATFARVGGDADLLVLIGQGRGVETSWRARIDQLVLRVATLKDAMVADALGGDLLDAVVDLRAPGASPPGS